MTAVAYKATDRARVAQYITEREAIEEKFQADCKDFEVKIGKSRLHGASGYNGSFHVQGYALESWNEDIPVGWRLDGSNRRTVPAKKTPEGKTIAKELQAH